MTLPGNGRASSKGRVRGRWGTAGHLTRRSLAPGFGEVSLAGQGLPNLDFQDSHPQGTLCSSSGPAIPLCSRLRAISDPCTSSSLGETTWVMGLAWHKHPVVSLPQGPSGQLNLLLLLSSQGPLPPSPAASPGLLAALRGLPGKREPTNFHLRSRKDEA